MKNNQRGFSLFELMFVVVLLLVTVGMIFELVAMAMQRSMTEQVKTDMVQETREFMDQIALDIRQAGYPSPRDFPLTGVLTVTPVSNDPHAAAGLVKVDSGDLWIEGDVDGSGIVSVVHYHLDTSTDNNCPCLKRSQLPKAQGDPVTGQSTPVYQMEVQNVQNTNIFSAYTWESTGAPIALPIDFDNNSNDIASTDTIKIVLTVQSLTPDPKTHQKPINTLVSTVRLNNCSQAAPGLTMSCQ